MPSSTALPRPAPIQIIALIAKELGVETRQVQAAVGLLDDGATVPFIARYRKEATGNLDDTQLRALEERLAYLRQLEERRNVILESIDQQGKLDGPLRTEIERATTKQLLEDLYLPYKPRRRTRAQLAREAGLWPLAETLLSDPTRNPESEAEKYLSRRSQSDEADVGPTPFSTVRAVLEGARDILAEHFAESAPLIGALRDKLWDEGVVAATVVAGREGTEDDKFRDYYAYTEAIRVIPSHRALALFRGQGLGILTLRLGLEELEETRVPHPCEGVIARHFHIEQRNRAADPWLLEVCRWTWRVKLLPHFTSELLGQLRQKSEAEAIRIFGRNLHELLLAAPAGPKVVMGIDPGIRTGCKIAVVDATGKLLDTTTIYPHPPRKEWQPSLSTLGRLVAQHRVELIAIGNGTASRETDRLVAELLRDRPAGSGIPQPFRLVVSEAGASVYSASEVAAHEFPELDVSLRGAVSIARRLQDPLAELVKIDPKAIGVGQYQHDVSQRDLARALDAVVEDCVNAVGVDVNTASMPLLARVSGLNPTLARHIVEFRETHGPYPNRNELRNVPRLGEKAFQQAAGFLRIVQDDRPDGNVLDRSAVHPEAYPLVERILKRLGKSIGEVMGQPSLLGSVAPAEFSDAQFGLPTVFDVLRELEKPGRDPRPEFQAARFREGVESMSDLSAGMLLEGVVTNVAAFGAFVDIGVHQDGLVHVSALSHRFVKDPHALVKPGQIVKVKVVEVDLKRQRIALTMRLDDDALSRASKSGQEPGTARRASTADRQQANRVDGASAMALAFAKIKR